MNQTDRSVAVIGAGYWGKNLVRNFHELGALAAICDSDEGRLRALEAQYPGVRTTATFADMPAVRTIQAVAIATPAELHGTMVNEALLADKDVFVDWRGISESFAKSSRQALKNKYMDKLENKAGL